MSNILVDFSDTYGAVRIDAYEMPVGGGNLLIKRATPSQDPSGEPDSGPWKLESIRGYDAPGWVEPGATSAGPIYDYLMPLGIESRYFLVDKDKKEATLADVPNAAYVTPKNRAWLRDIFQYSLTQPVTVIATDPVNKQARQTAYNIVGRTKPMVVWDLRLARSGTITLLVRNQTFDDYRQTRREKMDALLATGRPLLLSMDNALGFEPCFMAIQDAAYARLGRGAAWTLTLEYVEVDSPVGYGVTTPGDLLYGAAMDVPLPAATYQNWIETFDDYFDLVVGRVGA